jgi:queuine/archaeosine tRNA-ribosyltransferase
MLIKREGRNFEVDINGKSIKTPFFFPAISSVRTNLEIQSYLELILRMGYPGFLISAYDLYNSDVKIREKLIRMVSESTNNKTVTLLDSGHYEAYWFRDKKWSFDKMKNILGRVSIDLCFSFDIFWEENTKEEKYIKDTIKYTVMTSGFQQNGSTIPLIHAKAPLLPKLAKRIVKEVNPEIIGIPERELGASILERAKTVKQIRKALDETGRDIILHLLGTGNPISLAVYSVCGADTFDGLEWCKNAANPKTGQLLHFVQRDLIECECSACKIKGLPYHVSTIGHNLVFYRDFIERLTNSISSGEERKFLHRYLDEKTTTRVMKIVQ